MLNHGLPVSANDIKVELVGILKGVMTDIVIVANPVGLVLVGIAVTIAEAKLGQAA